jgi:hypothetical protein
MRQRMTLILRCLLLISTSLLSACASHVHRCNTDLYCEAKQDYARGMYHLAFNKVSYLAYRGDARAQYALGRMYYYGTGTAEDTQQGRMWIRVSASRNYPPAIEAISLIEDSDTPQYGELMPGKTTEIARVYSRNHANPRVNTTRRKTEPASVTSVHPKRFSQPKVSELQLPEAEFKLLPEPVFNPPVSPKTKTVSTSVRGPRRVAQKTYKALSKKRFAMRSSKIIQTRCFYSNGNLA